MSVTLIETPILCRVPPYRPAMPEPYLQLGILETGTTYQASMRPVMTKGDMWADNDGCLQSAEKLVKVLRRPLWEQQIIATWGEPLLDETMAGYGVLHLARLMADGQLGELRVEPYKGAHMMRVRRSTMEITALRQNQETVCQVQAGALAAAAVRLAIAATIHTEKAPETVPLYPSQASRPLPYDLTGERVIPGRGWCDSGRTVPGH